MVPVAPSYIEARQRLDATRLLRRRDERDVSVIGEVARWIGRQVAGGRLQLLDEGDVSLSVLRSGPAGLRIAVPVVGGH